MQKKYLYLLSALFLTSRFVVINPQPIFFDSPEYLTRLQNSFITAISTGHLPLHSGYLFFAWPIYHLAQLIHLEPLTTVLVAQSLLGLLSVFALFGVIRRLTNEKVAIWSIVVYSLLPLVWISQVSLMMEAAYLPFFIFALYYYLKYTGNKNNLSLFLASIFLAESFLTHFGIIIWIPLLYLFLILQTKTKQFTVLFSIIVSILLASFLNAYLMSIYSHAPLLVSLKQLYFAKTGEHANIPFSFIGGIIAFRNWSIPLLRNNTSTVIIVSIISAILVYKQNKSLLFILLLGITPSILANQWWDSLFFGRHALIASISFAILTGFAIAKHFKLRIAVLLFICVTVIPAMSLLKQPIPYLEMQKTAARLPSGGLYIESHFARPQLQYIYKGETIFVDEPGWVGNKLPEVINHYLNNKKPVFITSQALSEPYGLYSGPYLHTLSLSYKNGFDLQPLLQNYQTTDYDVVSLQDNLIVYSLIKNTHAKYPEILNMKNSYRRTDFTDPFFTLYRWLPSAFVQ
jgi:hypothetical protein